MDNIIAGDEGVTFQGNLAEVSASLTRVVSAYLNMANNFVDANTAERLLDEAVKLGKKLKGGMVSGGSIKVDNEEDFKFIQERLPAIMEVAKFIKRSGAEFDTWEEFEEFIEKGGK